MASLLKNKKGSGRKKRILSIDAYGKTSYLYDGKAIKEVKHPKFDKKTMTIASLGANDFVTSLVEISVNTPEEDLQDTIEIKTFEDLGLNQETEYIIRYFEAPEMAHEATRYFHVFVAEASTILDVFEDSVKKVKYIDYIIPKPMLIRNIYNASIINAKGVHGYLYFSKGDAFITFYQDGRFFYVKPIKFTLQYIYDKFCELYGEVVDQQAFFRMLEEDGLRTPNLDYQDVLMRLFSEIFMHVGDILTYVKRAYNLENITIFYIGSEYGPILGLNEYAQTYLGVEALDFNFDYGIDHSDWYVDQFHYLNVLEVQYGKRDESEALNFTLFHRPPPFPKRKSGQFILTTAAATVLALSVPIYNYVYDYYTKAAIMLLSKEEQKLRIETTALRNEIAALQKSKDHYAKLINDEKSLLKRKQEVLAKVYDKKVNYPMKAKNILLFANDMKPFNVRTVSIINEEKDFNLSLVAKDEKKITEYIKAVTKKYGDQVKTDINKIAIDKKGNYYYGDLQVTLR